MTTDDSSPATAGNSVTRELTEQESLVLLVYRLAKEKKAAEEDYKALGYESGRSYVLQASYLDILHVTQTFWPFDEDGRPVDEQVFGDAVLGKVFEEAFMKYPPMTYHWKCYDIGPFIDELGTIFIMAFIDGVEDVWNKVGRSLRKDDYKRDSDTPF
jgi:hypothetical protein